MDIADGPMHAALEAIPDRTELRLDGHVLGVVASWWRNFPLSYDWNPQRIRLRDHQQRYRITRFGGFAVLTCPGPGDGASASLLWGRGSREDLSAALTGRTLLRTDRETAENATSVGTGLRVAAFPTPNFNEYLYGLTEQNELQGKRFARRRTYLRALERAARRVDFAELNLGAADDAQAVLDVYSRWEDTHVGADSVNDERTALECLLTGAATGETTYAVGLRVDDELAGFAIYDVLAAGVATAHFVKARRNSAEVAATWQALFTAAYHAGASLLNGGYDGGLQGLRAAKKGLRPRAMRDAFLVVSG